MEKFIYSSQGLGEHKLLSPVGQEHHIFGLANRGVVLLHHGRFVLLEVLHVEAEDR